MQRYQPTVSHAAAKKVIRPQWTILSATEGEVRCGCNKKLLRFFRPEGGGKMRVELHCPRCRGIGDIVLSFSTRAA